MSTPLPVTARARPPPWPVPMRLLPRVPLAWRSPATKAEPGREPLRTCIGCRRRAAQRGLIRVTRTAEGRLVVGRTQPGRGAWLCASSPNCLAEALRRRAFARALRAPVLDADELGRKLAGPDN